MTKIEAVGNKDRIEHQAAKQDWEGTTMTKQEAVQEVKNLPKDKQGLLKSGSVGYAPEVMLDTKPESRKGTQYIPASSQVQAAKSEGRMGVPFQPPPQSGDIGLRKSDLKKEKDNELLERESQIKNQANEKAAEIKGRVREMGEQVKDRAYERGEEIKNRAREKGEDIKNQIRETGEEGKRRSLMTEAEDWARLEAELARNKVQQSERYLGEKKNQAISSIRGVENKAVSEAKDFGSAVTETAKEVKEGLYNLGGEMKEGAQQRWEGFKEVVAEAPRTIAQEGEHLGKVVKDKLVTAEEKAKEAVWGTEKKAKEDLEYGKAKTKEAIEEGKETLYDTGIKAKDYAKKAKEYLLVKQDDIQDKSKKTSEEIKREAQYAKDKVGQAWEEGKSEAKMLKDQTIPSMTDKAVKEVKDFGTAVAATAKDVKEGLTPSTSPPRRTRSSSFGEAIDRAFTSTPDTNRPSPTEWSWGRVQETAQLPVPSSSSVPLLSDETEARRILREKVIEEEKRSPGFVSSMVEFVFGPSRNPDLTSHEFTERERANQRASRINSVAYSPAGGITPDDFEDSPALVTSPSLPIRRHSIAGDKPLAYPADTQRVEYDADAAKKLERLSSVQYSPAIGATYDYVKDTKKEDSSFSLPTFTTYDPSFHPLESRTSSYYQTYRTSMPSEEVEERVLESTIDFFY